MIGGGVLGACMCDDTSIHAILGRPFLTSICAPKTMGASIFARYTLIQYLFYN